MRNANDKKNPTLILLAVYMAIVTIGVIAAIVRAWHSGSAHP